MVSRASGGALSVLVVFCSAQGTAGCDAVPTEVEPSETGAAAPTEVAPREVASRAPRQAAAAPTEVAPCAPRQAAAAPTEVAPRAPRQAAAAPTEVAPREAAVPDPAGATSPSRHASPAPCALPCGFSAGAPARFPATSRPAIGHRLSGSPGTDAFGRFLRSTVMFCGPDEQPYFLRYRYYLTGPLSGRWLRPPLAEPL